ncbi:hypothetical protein ABW21_db0200343 [Orbilia brochopaga]|nr:hypothetical protein ABW21_db0200343 [Drechslerella brochopaga]
MYTIADITSDVGAGAEGTRAEAEASKRKRPDDEQVDEFEMSRNRRQVGGTKERYEVEGRSRSSGGTWDWYAGIGGGLLSGGLKGFRKREADVSALPNEHDENEDG